MIGGIYGKESTQITVTTVFDGGLQARIFSRT